MDETFLKLVSEHEEAVAGGPGGTVNTELTFQDPDKAEIELRTGDQHVSYMLKTLAELYGRGQGGAVDPQRDEFMPLFLGIESGIAAFDERSRLTDGKVLLALNALGMNPEAPSNDPLVDWLQRHLRLILSLHNYSRQEVRTAIRRIERSVQRHQEGGRGRAYLNFIADYV